MAIVWSRPPVARPDDAAVEAAIRDLLQAEFLGRVIDPLLISEIASRINAKLPPRTLKIIRVERKPITIEDDE